MESADKEEVFAWKVATIVMALFSLFALTTTISGMNPFSLLFNVALVYLPAVILLGSALIGRTKKAA